MHAGYAAPRPAAALQDPAATGDPIGNRFSPSPCGMPSRGYIPDKPNLSSIRNP